MTMKRFTFAGLMSAAICALMLMTAPGARAQVAAQDSVLLDPFDPVPEIQFRHFGGVGCWDDCGYRDCDGCGRCNDGCGRSRCYRGCGRTRCWRDCNGRLHCTRGCRNNGNYDRGARFDHDAARAENDHYRFRDDERRFHHDAHEYERDDRAWHDRYGIERRHDHDGRDDHDGHWDHDGHDGRGDHEGYRDREGHDWHDGGGDGAAARHEDHVQERNRDERYEDKAVEHAIQQDRDGWYDGDDDEDGDSPPPARH